jgi:hypothetical protein
MTRLLSIGAAVCLVSMSVTGCKRRVDTAVPVAAVQVTLSRPIGTIGGPLDMTYRFTVANDAPPFSDDNWVFVHFIDSDGELVWTDDHEPTPPTQQWKPGASIAYTRTIFIPKFAYAGQTSVEVGLFSRRTGQRLPLNAPVAGQRSYKVARFTIQPQADALVVVFKDGWHATEQGTERGHEWQWSRKDATFGFRNPHRNVLLYLMLDRPGGFREPQHVRLSIGNSPVDAFALPPDKEDLRKIPISMAQLGPSDAVELKLTVDRAFVPAEMPELKSRDSRELGVRVFHAFIQPQ